MSICDLFYTTLKFNYKIIYWNFYLQYFLYSSISFNALMIFYYLKFMKLNEIIIDKKEKDSGIPNLLNE